jgi:hypothetical protein
VELLAYKDAGRWHDVTSTDINAHLQEMSGNPPTAAAGPTRDQCSLTSYESRSPTE